jgi:hypothetical protein
VDFIARSYPGLLVVDRGSSQMAASVPMTTSDILPPPNLLLVHQKTSQCRQNQIQCRSSDKFRTTHHRFDCKAALKGADNRKRDKEIDFHCALK